MPVQTFEAILKDLKNKVYHPVYFLTGDEPYYIDEIAQAIESGVLSDMEKEFNQTILYGRDVDAKTIVSHAKRYPMMANYQVVIVREAQDVKNLFPKKGSDDEEENDGGTVQDADRDLFFEYLSNPLPSTLLVLCYKYKKADKRTKSGKILDKAGVFFESKKLYDDKIAGWISAYVKNKGFRIDDGAAVLLGEYLGVELSKVANELDKLMIGRQPGTVLDAELIEKNIGISKDFNVFELQKAFTKKDVFKANMIVDYFGKNPKSNPMVLTLATLHTFFTKIISVHVYKNKPGVNLAQVLGVHPFFLKDYEMAARTFSTEHCIKTISWIQECDLKSKGMGNVSASDHEILQELVFKILHPSAVEV